MSTYGTRQALIDTFMSVNQQINLSAIRDAQGIYEKHILDSIELNKVFTFPKSTSSEKALILLDLGTGGGFPLLPLAMTHPEIRCYGMDARKKKCSAVQSIADTLGITNVKTIRARAEDHKQQYDIVTARAVAHASKLLPRALPLVKKGGYLVLYKQFSLDEDVIITNALDMYHLQLITLHHYHLPASDIERVIYVMQK